MKINTFESVNYKTFPLNKVTLPNFSNIQEINPVEVASVTICLTNHDKCNGKYTDSASGKYLVSCKCPCHTGITH